MKSKIRERGIANAFGRRYTAYDFPASKKLVLTTSKKLLLELFPDEMKPSSNDTVPLFHFPNNFYDHYGYTVAKWYSPETLFLFDQHSETYPFHPECIECGNWVAHLLNDKIVSKVVWLRGEKGIKYSFVRTDMHSTPTKYSSMNLNGLVEEHFVEKEKIMVHFDPDVLEVYHAKGAVRSTYSDLNVDEVISAISVIANSPHLVAFSIGENIERLYQV